MTYTTKSYINFKCTDLLLCRSNNSVCRTFVFCCGAVKTLNSSSSSRIEVAVDL